MQSSCLFISKRVLKQDFHLKCFSLHSFFICLFVKTIAASRENQQSAYAKTNMQISFAITAKLISAVVFATQIVHFLFFLNPKFEASSLPL